MALTSGERAALWRKRQRDDPVKHEAYKKKERDRYRKKKESGQVKSISEMTSREQRKKRKQWRRNQKAKRQRHKTLMSAVDSQITPPTSPELLQLDPPNSRKALGRKKKNLNRSAAYRIQFKLRIQLSKERRLKEKYKKRCYRMQAQSASDVIKVKVKDTINRKEVLSALTMYHIIVKNTRDRYVKANRQEKKIVRNLLFRENLLKKYRIASYAQTVLGIQRHTRENKVPKRKYQKIREAIKDKIVKFYQREDNSRLKAGKRSTTTKNGMKKQVRLLNDSIKNIHKKYLLENSTKVSYSLFAKFKPFWVVQATEKDRETCLCKLHENPKLKINRLFSEKVLESKDINSLVQDITCSTKSKECMYRECGNCNAKKIKIRKVPGKTVNWYCWATRKIELDQEQSNADGSVKKQTKTMTIKSKETGSIQTLIDALQIDIERICRHIYNIEHQYIEVKHLKDSCSDSEAIIHVDFSENYQCKYTEEITSTHFGASQRQISIHTGVAYLKNETVPFASVSDCLQHGPSGIWAHLDPVIKYLQEKSPQKIKRLHFISDGPTTQYRSRQNFYLASKRIFQYGLSEGGTWNFLEAGHGKGAPDGIGAVIKRHADCLVNTQGRDVTCAAELIQGINDVDSSEVMFKVEETDVCKVKEEIPTSIAAVPDTMKIHQVVINTQLEVKTRVLNCFCADDRLSCCCYNPTTTVFQPVLPKPSPKKGNACTLTELERPQSLLVIPELTDALINKYCVVEYDGLPYPGLILDVDDDSIELKAMHRIGNNRFFWPLTEDVLWYTRDKIVTMLEGEPEHVTGRHKQLNGAVWEAITKKMDL